MAKDARVQAFWAEVCAASGVPEGTDYQAWHFGDSAELPHELVELVVGSHPRRIVSAHS